VNEEPLRIVVFGYHTIGYRCLKELLDRGEEVRALVTHQDDPHEQVWFESVAELAQTSGVPVLSPKTPNTPAFIDSITSPISSCRSITVASSVRSCWRSHA
jgi:methionyl-tRNA formyltransferase